MKDEVKTKEQLIEDLAALRDRYYDIGTAVNALLRLSLEDYSLEELLQKALDIILSVPSLSIETKGSIFLVEDEPEVLVQKVQKGLAEPLLKECARVPFGKCLCGRAASIKRIEFADHIDERHEVSYEGIAPHGHYCVPILLSGNTIGVINLYLKDGHSRVGTEEEFLDSVANTLAGIIKRKRMEQALRRSEELYRTFLESTMDMVLLKDDELRHIMVNKSLLDFMGKEENEIIGKTDAELLPQSIAQVCRQTDMDVIQSGAIVQTEEPMHDGIYETRKFPVSIGGGKVGVGTYIRDITDRKRAEENLRLDEARLESLLKISQYEADTIQDLVDYALAEAITLTGSKIGYVYFYDDQKKEFILNTWSKNVMKECTIAEPQTIYHLEKMGIWGEAVRQGKPIILNDFQAPHPLKKGYPDGHAELYKYMTIPVFAQDKIVAAVAVANKATNYDQSDIRQLTLLMDSVWKIAERKLAEEALKESEEKYRSIVENAQEGIYRTTPEGRFITVNRAMVDMLGYDAPEELIASFTDITHQLYVNPEDRTKLRRIVEEHGYIRGFETQFYKKDGNWIWVSIHIRAVHDTSGRILYYEGINEDITIRKQADEERKQSFERLRKALGSTIQVMVSAVEMRDPYTAGHQIRSTNLARAIAKEMRLPQEKIDGIRMAGSIHDIGKLSIPAEILVKPTKLTDIEFSLIKEHSRRGYEMLKDVESQWPLAEIVYQHHERMDGSGYPRRLKGEEILMEARILAVADVVESMASDRPYRPGLGIDAALEEIEKNRGTFYDNGVADACLRLFREKGFQLEGTKF
ncbi:MAG: HD domain-containing phosphohydrolase [Deltaproteobacteria bacterium]